MKTSQLFDDNSRIVCDTINSWTGSNITPSTDLCDLLVIINNGLARITDETLACRQSFDAGKYEDILEGLQELIKLKRQLCGWKSLIAGSLNNEKAEIEALFQELDEIH